LADRLSGTQDALAQLIEALSHAANHAGASDELAMATAQRQALSQLQHRIAFAGPQDLPALRAEVVASIAATQATLPQASTGLASARAAEAALHAANAAAHATVRDFVSDFYDKKIFDPYLHFASAEDEAAYRKREAERREAIEKAMAEGTPEGNLQALRLSKEQLLDAGAHGADASPDYARDLAALEKAEARIGASMPTEERAATASDDPAAALLAAGVTFDSSPTTPLPVNDARAPSRGRG
jgi:hypothetical protein